MSDVLIVGGGVIGLSLAYELAGKGARVHVLDAGQPGREASWAGAGILPPAPADGDDSLEQLTALSNDLHRQWSQELRAATGIDNGYRRCGAIYLEREAAAAERLTQFAAFAQLRGVRAELLSPENLAEREPAVASAAVRAAYLVPDECQIRNPRHLRALLMGCEQRGVQITPCAAAEAFDVGADRVRAVRTAAGTFAADKFCIATGAWSALLAARLGASPAIKPIRGQMLLFQASQPVLARIVNEGSRYLVPRGDGRVLAGSTEEDVGFDRSTTSGATSALLGFALALVPDLAAATLERTWAGLRPATADGLPYLGPVPDLANVWMAAGHFRGGLQLSTGTALVMGQLLRGLAPQIDLGRFRIDRATSGAAPPRTARPRRRELPLH
ncbi:MAG: glycine oxidase ThiO [Pirellulales bacterium]